METPSQPARLDRYAALFALCVSLLFFLPALGNSAIQREQELRVALTARDMAEGGSWLEPHYLGQLRLRKPPLMYWFVATAYRAGGATDSAWLARLPSALSGAALGLLVFLIARKFFGKRRALIASIICSTSLIILRQARLAETDVLLAFWVTLAAWSGYRAIFAGGRWRWSLLAGLASGLGFMTKGPAAFVLPGFAWSAFIIARRKQTGKPLRFTPTAANLAIWAILALLVAAPWYAYLVIRAGSLAQLQQELSATFGDATQHPDHWYYYGYTIFQALAPWSLLIPFSIPALWKGARKNNALRFTIGWFATTFLALTFTSSKQIHYTTLLAPSASILIGWYLGLLYRRRRIFARLALPALFIFWLLTMLTAARIVPASKPKQVIMDTTIQYQTRIKTAQHVFLIGGNRASWEFHSGRPIIELASVEDAAKRAHPNDLIIFNGKTDSPPSAPNDTTALVSTVRYGFHCAIWQKD